MPRIEDHRSMDIAKPQIKQTSSHLLRKICIIMYKYFFDDFLTNITKIPRIENHRSMDIARGSHHGLVVPISCTTHFSHILFCFWNPKQKSIEFPSNSKCLCIHVCLLCFDFISINVTSSSHN